MATPRECGGGHGLPAIHRCLTGIALVAVLPNVPPPPAVRVSGPAVNAIGVFDAQTDVGRARRGSASYDTRTQTYTIAGSGQNMWNDRDDFHFVWTRLSGNFILSTRTRFLSAGV